MPNTNNANVKPFGRVLYVEPNDVNGKINGVPMTPDYTDMCISFNLICEVKSRIKNDNPVGETLVTDTDKKKKKPSSAIYQIFGVTGNGETKSWVSFLQGQNYGDTNFLTTYYTDINYQDHLKDNIVEGLGVENITISHESYYTPTVTIKFVDHRGAALFGREESIHYNDKITIDNIFGAFFTAPYPEYYLQVKGFYGKPITYRLCCTAFKGSLNSQTGNFEATATFIGYSYSLLTDIPFEYLVAAPYCEYFGKDYWDTKKSQDEWRMYGCFEGDDVPTFFELFQRIEAAFTDPTLLEAITGEQKKELDSSENQKSYLSSINDLFNSYVDLLKSKAVSYISDRDKYDVTEYDGDGNIINDRLSENEQLLLMKSDNFESEWASIEKVWNDLTATIDEYNGVYEDDTISKDVLPNKLPFTQMRFTDYFVKTNNKITIKNIENISVEEIQKTKINNVTPSEFIAKGIIEALNDKDAISKVNRYVYLVDLGTLYYSIQIKIDTLKTSVDEINRQQERNYIDLAINHLGLAPYMGNIFKLIICHIETFVHMMQQCFINIENAKKVGQRSPEYLHVNIKNTDFLSNDNDIFLPPWPAVNRKVTGDERYSSVEHNTTYGWVGDFSPYFEEAKLVRSLYLACKRTAKDPKKTDEDKPVQFLYAPIIPNDLNNNANPFIGGGKDMSSMAGMLGLRAAQIFGIGEKTTIDEEIAKLIGKIDALNYYRYVGNKTDLSKILEENDGNLAEALFDIMLCKPTADKYGKVDQNTNQSIQAFEKTNGMFPQLISGDRQPIYVDGKEVLYYTYMHTKSKFGIIPANTRNWDSYGEIFVPDGTKETGRYFNYTLTPKDGKLIGDSFLHLCTATQLFSDYKSPDDKSMYINSEMYTIVTNKALITGILKRYEEMSGGSVSVLGEKFTIDMSKVLNHYWIVNKDKKYWYYNKTNGFLGKDYKDNGIEDKMFLNSVTDYQYDLSDTYDKLKEYKFASFTETKATIDKENVDVNTLKFPLVPCIYNGTVMSLFGVGFYYMQNQISDESVRRKVKALLFLHTLRYDFSHTMLWDDASIKSSAIRRIPFGLAALYGGLLWRHNYIKTHNNIDPIQYRDNGGTAYQPAFAKGVEYSLTYATDDGTYLNIISETTNAKYRNTVFRQKGSDTHYVFANKPDYFVANELIRVFEEFVSKQWPTISQMELCKKNGSMFANGSEFISHVNELAIAYSTAISDANTLKEEEQKENNETTSANTNENTDTDKKDNIDIVVKGKNDALKANANTFSNFEKYYCYLWTNFKNAKDCMNLWNNTTNIEVQNALASVYLGECIELRSSAHIFGLNLDAANKVYTDIVVSSTNMRSYLSGFADQLSDIVKNTNNDTHTGEDPLVVEETPEFNRETALPIYMYLKMLWDKWLVSIDMNDHDFMVKNFTDNFVFIDSFYRNIAHRFMCNCQILLDCYNNNVTSNSDITVFKFIGDITTKHNCIFVAVPDFITAWSHEDDTDVKTSMETVFKPMPYNSIGDMKINNKFVVLYVPKLSETPSELNNYREDSFNIWSYNDEMTIKGDPTVKTQYNGLPHLLENVGEVVAQAFEQGVDLTEYAYYVPAFGLAYGRQNNHIFKNVNLSMETPAITSTVINTLSHVARIGSNNTHRVAFIGQDLYPTYSNYAYICEFEMMGDAQIQPLMYFQLMNVPMWRGTYIIYSVTHTMTPGNMVTKVKAMKLSNRGVPYSNAWFTENPGFDPEALRKLECLDKIASGGFAINVNGSVANQDCIPSGGNLDGWKTTVMEMAKWYVENVHGYNNGKRTYGDGVREHQHPKGLTVTADCVGFVAACLRAFGSKISGNYSFYGEYAGKSLEEYKTASDVQVLLSEGFAVMDYNKSSLQPFDIMVRYAPTGSASGHTEIYAGNGQSYTWGNVYQSLPRSTTFYTEDGYQKIIRYMGGAVNTCSTSGGSGNLAAINTNGTKPVLIGDSWAKGMSSYFGGASAAISGSCISTDTPSFKSAKTQITNYLKTNPNPKFILCYTGRNDNSTNLAYKEKQYTQLIQACNGRTIYIIQEQYDCHHATCGNDTFSKSVIDTNNNAIRNACAKFNNASMINVTIDHKSLMQCCTNNGCGCTNNTDGSFHLTGEGNKTLLRKALEVIGQTSYLK